MIVILKKVSTKTRKQDIRNFILPAVKGGWFTGGGKIHSILILSQRNIRTRVIQNHVLVEIHPDVVAERAIKKLNGKTMVGKHIAVSEYRVRNWHNDPRINHSYAIVRKRVCDRRMCDRRNQYEEILSKDELVVANKRAFGIKLEKPKKPE